MKACVFVVIVVLIRLLAVAQEPAPNTPFSAEVENATSKNAPQTNVAVKTPNPPGGKVGFLPLWSAAPNIIGNSSVFQSGSNVGIGTTTPAALLDVNGGSITRGDHSITGNLNLSPTSGASTGVITSGGHPFIHT